MDVRDATDLFSSIYSQTGGLDGRVSIEVDPRLTHDTEATSPRPRNCSLSLTGQMC